jgi:hypothetical protein
MIRKGNEMKIKSFLFGLFIGFTVVLVSGADLGRQAAQFTRDSIALQNQRREEERRHWEEIGLPGFGQRFEELEAQVKILNELPVIKKQIEVRKQKLLHDAVRDQNLGVGSQ